MDSLNSKITTDSYSPKFEQLAILYNIASCLTHMARYCDTSTDEGTKSANERLKLAAGVMSYLKTTMTDIDFKSPDFSEPALN